MLIRLKHPLKPKPEPTPRQLRPYMSANVCTIGGNPDRDELLAILKDSPKPVIHIFKRKLRETQVKFRGVLKLNQTDVSPPKHCAACNGKLQRTGSCSVGRVQYFFCPECNITVIFDGVSGATSMCKLEIVHK